MCLLFLLKKLKELFGQPNSSFNFQSDSFNFWVIGEFCLLLLIPGSGRSPGGGNGNPTPVFLPGIPWAEAPGHLLCPWGHREPDTTE